MNYIRAMQFNHAMLGHSIYTDILIRKFHLQIKAFSTIQTLNYKHMNNFKKMIY